jgi:hypothetical protein
LDTKHFLRNSFRRIAMLVPAVRRIVDQRDSLIQEIQLLRSGSADIVDSDIDNAEVRGLERLLHRPFRELRASPAKSPGEPCDDAAMIKRLLDAYKASASASSAKPTAIWRTIFDTRQLPLHRILVSDDVEAAAALLRRPGDSNLFWGFDGLVAESVKRFDSSRDYSTAVAKMCHDLLIRVAEAIGAVPCENPEAPGSTPMYGFKPVDELLAAIDGAVGCEIRFPNPYPDEIGVKTGRGVASYRAIHAIYQAWRIRELVGGIARPRVLELGAGLGRTAYYARQLGILDYTIIDLPFTEISQGYFLMRTLGGEEVLLEGESGRDATTKVKIFNPPFFLEGSDEYDLVVNVDSLTEMDRAAAERYWKRIQTAAPLFLSINHDSNPFTVKELIGGGKPRVVSTHRHLNAVRRGYVEELVYLRR